MTERAGTWDLPNAERVQVRNRGKLTTVGMLSVEAGVYQTNLTGMVMLARRAVGFTPALFEKISDAIPEGRIECMDEAYGQSQVKVIQVEAAKQFGYLANDDGHDRYYIPLAKFKTFGADGKQIKAASSKRTKAASSLQARPRATSGRLVRSRAELEALVEHYMGVDAFAYDTETVGEHRGTPALNEVAWFSFATYGRADTVIAGKAEPGRYCIEGANLDYTHDECLEILRPLFVTTPRNDGRTLVGQNLPFDLGTLFKYYGQVPDGPYFDTLIAYWLLDEESPKDLKTLSEQILRLPYDNPETGKIGVNRFPLRDVARYAFDDAKKTWLLKPHLEPKLAEQGLENAWALEMDVLPVVVRMGQVGALIDDVEVTKYAEELQAKIDHLHAKINLAAGKKVNLNSSPQRTWLVYNHLGYAVERQTKSGAPSTDRDALEGLLGVESGMQTSTGFDTEQVLRDMLEHADYDTQQKTFVAGMLPRLVNNRLYAELVQYGTKTGRFSCRNPNLQNQPSRDRAGGKRIRSFYVPPAGCKMVVGDFSQIEMRVLAYYSRDPKLIQMFDDDIDPHTGTAAIILGVAPEDVTEEQRRMGKGGNFAIIYGAGPERVALQTGQSVRAVENFFKVHRKEFPRIYDFKERAVAVCRSRSKDEDGNRQVPYIKTMSGRRRRLPMIYARDKGLRGRAERQAVNTIIQGTAADIQKMAMVRADRMLGEVGVDLVLSVHDELGAYAPWEIADEAAKIMQEAMEGIRVIDPVPLKVDVGIGDNWSAAK